MAKKHHPTRPKMGKSYKTQNLFSVSWQTSETSNKGGLDEVTLYTYRFRMFLYKLSF